jgi:hypothetical protein
VKVKASHCRHCGKRIYLIQYVGWVEATPDEVPGNYDLCEKNPPDLDHEPLG